MSQTYQEMDLGPRIGAFLRSIYAGSRAKNLARDFNVSEATAKRWLGGTRPTSEILVEMARLWGWRFVTFAFEPAVGTPAMYAEMQRFDDRLSRLEAERLAEDARGALAIAGTVPSSAGEVARVGRPDEAEADPVASPVTRRLREALQARLRGEPGAPR